MKIAIVGGALQGVEVAYLARKAGIESVLLDRRAAVPARCLCDHFRQVDVTDRRALDRAAADVDLIFPALENPTASFHLEAYARRRKLPMIHDPGAYAVSGSKIASERFFRKIGIPVPVSWPEARFPVIAKPSYGSGSQGIQLFRDRGCLELAIGSNPASQNWIVQSFLPGPTYSIEVLRADGCSKAVQVTDLHMDAEFDCKRVTAPSTLSTDLQKQLADLSLMMADALELKGIMDVEAVLHDGTLKILEIDARFPSQTPITVYWSCGVNMVEGLIKTNYGAVPSGPMAAIRPDHGVVFEHIRVTPGNLWVTGEHALASADRLKVHRDFFGSDEAITDFEEGKDQWVATLICCGTDLSEAWQRRQAVVSAICSRYKIDNYRDPSPAALSEVYTS